MAFETEIKVVFRDLDAMGHVNNATFFTYMETARTEYYFARSGSRDLTDLEFILARACCDFRSPANIGEVLVIRTWPMRIGTSSFTFRYEMREKSSGRLVAEGESVQVAYDYKFRKTVPLPEAFRKALEKDLISE